MVDAGTDDDPGRAAPRLGVTAVVAALSALLGVAVGAWIAALVLDDPAGPGAVAVGDGGRGGVADVAAAVLGSVVRVDVRGIGDGGSGNAAGVVLDGEGHVVTNHHVVAGATAITVSTDDRHGLRAELVGSDPRTDVAVLAVPDLDADPIAVAPSADVRVGQLAVAVGSPFGLDGSVTAGVVSAVDRPIDLRVPDGSTVRLAGVLQTDASINPGNSGGPLVDSDGRMIGLASAVLGDQTAGEVGFAIPSDVVVAVVEELLASGSVATPYLGVAGSDLDAAAREALGVDGGALVERVAEGSPAAGAGLRAGDVVTAVDGEPLDGVDHLVARVTDAEVGARIDLRYLRDGAVRTATVTLGRADD
ncbi:S1C family serine protease [Euzebya sp.]|uniref:S1C family serine protease n=1 Tax=Euzebya sp. TaxID=1971409 RepID=UPI0035144E83